MNNLVSRCVLIKVLPACESESASKITRLYYWQALLENLFLYAHLKLRWIAMLLLSNIGMSQ